MSAAKPHVTVFVRRGLLGSTYTTRTNGVTTGVVRRAELVPGWLLDSRDYYRSKRERGGSVPWSVWYAIGGFNLVGDDDD